MPIARIGDIDMEYIEAGSGPPLVLLHGLGGAGSDWEHQIPFFAQRYRVIAPDLRGFGGTPLGRGLPSIRRFADDVWALLQQLGIERFLLMGHSMGGAVSLQLSLNHPEAVQRLVIANSVPSFQPQSLRHYLEFGYRWVVMGLLGPARLARIGAWRMFPDDDQADERNKSIARGARNSRAAYLGSLASLSRWSVIDRLESLMVPTFVVGSEHDYFTHEETVTFAHALPHGRLHIVDGAHHSLPAEHPEIFNPLVQRFFNQRAPGLRKRSTR